MEEIDVFKSLRESVDGELAPIVDEREAARLKLIIGLSDRVSGCLTFSIITPSWNPSGNF